MKSRPPADPRIRDLASQLRRQSVSRRHLLRAGLGVGAAGAAAGLLSACAPPAPPAGAAATLQLPTDASADSPTLYFANWTAYMDTSADGSSYPTLQEFEKRTGITVTYSVDIDDNNTYFSKVAPLLQARSAFDPDIFVFTDWMANRVLRNQYAQPLDLIQMPHATNLLPSLKEVPFDPGRHYSLPWQGGFGGIGWNRTKLARDLRTIDDLWADDLKGRVVVLSEMRDTVGLVMQSQGVSVAGDFSSDQLQKAMDVISARIADGHIRRVQGNAYLQELKSGNALAGIVWSGDMATLRTESPDVDWQFVLPESGATLWTDNMMIPITSAHRSNALKLMDYYYEPAVAAQLAAYVNYVCPVVGAQEELAKTDPQLAESWTIFPSSDFLRQHNVQTFRALSADEDSEYSAMWAKVVGN